MLHILVIAFQALLAAHAAGSRNVHRHRLRRQQQQAGTPAPPLLPPRFGVSPEDAASPGPPAGDWIDITDYNISTDGTRDVSGVVTAIGRANTHGAVLLFPGRLGNGPDGAAAGWLPSKYLIDPAELLGGYRAWNAPPQLTLWLEPGAALVTAAGVRVYLGGPVRAGGYHIFDSLSHPLAAQITSNGTNATVTVGAGQGLKVGDRFRVAGAAQPEFNGYWSVFTASGASFSYQMAEQPDPSSTMAEAGGAPQVTFAGFYFGAQKQRHNLPGDADSPNAWAYPEWWGASPANTGVDDTTAVQFALDCGFPVRFLQSYNVERVTMTGGTVLDGSNHQLVGNAKRQTNAVLEVKADMSDIHNLQVNAGFGVWYEAGIHWYTNQVNVNYVGFNRLRNIVIFYAKYGLLIGAPKEQGAIHWQGYTAPDGQATNAPLSESNMDGFLFYGCQVAIWFRQPNGFLEISNSVIGVQPNEWPKGLYDWNQSAAIEIHEDGSLNVVNCDLESVIGAEWNHPGNRLVNITAGTLNMVDVTVESQSSFHIGGSGVVTWNGNQDGGMNGFGGMLYPPPYFDIAPGAMGRLTLKNQEFSRGAGYGRECRAPFVSRNITDAPPGSCRLHGQTLDCGEFNSTFRVVFDGLVLRDWTWTAVCGGDGTPKTDPACGYYPPARGVDLEIQNLLMTTWVYDNTPTSYGSANLSLVSERLFATSGAHNLLRTAHDVSGAAVKAGPVNATDNGGWSTHGCATGCSFGPLRHPLPSTTAGVKPGPAPVAAVTLASASGPAGWVNATIGMAGAAVLPRGVRVSVEPGRNYVLSGWIRTNGEGQVALTPRYFGFGGESCSAVAPAAMSLPGSMIGFHVGRPHWEPLLLPVTPPADAAVLALQFGASGGAALDLYALALR